MVPNLYLSGYPVIMKLLIFRIVLLSIVVSQALMGQNVDNLRSQRDLLLKEIANTNKLLQDKRSTRESAFQQVQVIAREVSVREQLLASLEQEISLIDQSLEFNQLQINKLEVDLNAIKQEYALLIQDTYKRRNALEELAFFMSANGFSEAYRRYRLLKEYSQYRQNQGRILKDSQDKLRALLQDIKAQRDQKEKSLQELEREYRLLENSRREKNRLVTNLQKEEQWLLTNLRAKEKQAKDLENRILEYIRTASVSNLGTDFKDFAGKLIWPVSSGVIVNRFGEHEHPVLKNVTIKNNGIDIQSVAGDDVFAVHMGEVSRVVAIPGYNTAVIVRHGTFLTVYANMREVAVKQGQSVNAGTILGKVYKETGQANGVLHFEIWNGNQKLDPAKWLRP